MNEQELSRLAAHTVDTLARLPGGLILAVWPDGSVSTESPGFVVRRDGGRITQPLLTLQTGRMLSFHEVQTQLFAAARDHNLLNQPPH